MKTITAIILTFLTISIYATSKKVTIKANQTVELNYKEFATSDVKIQNTSLRQIEVSVNEISTGEQIKGFGLDAKANAIVAIENGRVLKLKNSSSKDILVKLEFVEKKKSIPKTANNYINFTLRNPSSKSIPLIIPNVMNPNLSPFSSSGVRLKIGQEILFRYRGKKRVLLVVTDEIKEGDKLDIKAILEQKIEEIKSKK